MTRFSSMADAFQQVVEVEDAGDLARDLVQHGQRLRLARDAGVEPRILHRDGHARGGQFQQPLVLVGEVAGLLGLEIDDADDAVLHDQRHGQLGQHVRVGVDVVLPRAHVLDQDRPALTRRLAHDAAAGLDAHALDLRRVAGLEAHAQIAGAVVDQQDGEDAVVDDGAHQVRDAVHQRVQVERGVQRVGQAHQEVELQRLQPDIRGSRQLGRCEGRTPPGRSVCAGR